MIFANVCVHSNNPSAELEHIMELYKAVLHLIHFESDGHEWMLAGRPL